MRCCATSFPRAALSPVSVSLLSVRLSQQPCVDNITLPLRTLLRLVSFAGFPDMVQHLPGSWCCTISLLRLLQQLAAHSCSSVLSRRLIFYSRLSEHSSSAGPLSAQFVIFLPASHTLKNVYVSIDSKVSDEMVFPLFHGSSFIQHDG